MTTNPGPGSPARPETAAGPDNEAEDPRITFRTTLLRDGKTATGIEVPADLVAKLGTGKRPPVRVTVNGHSYLSTVAMMGGRYKVPVSAENRAGAGIEGGDEIDVELVLDTAPREVTLPADFTEALAADPRARERFAALSYTHRKEHVRAIESAKAPETRRRRIEKAIATLRDG